MEEFVNLHLKKIFWMFKTMCQTEFSIKSQKDWYGWTWAAYCHDAYFQVQK